MSKEQTPYFNLEAFVRDFREVVRERNMTAQQVSNVTHVARPTVTKILGGNHMCDGPTLAILSCWARLQIESYVEGITHTATPGSTEDKVLALIREDQSITNKAKIALSKAYKALYKALK